MIRTGTEIKNKQDLRNLIVSIILRQKKEYKPLDIIETTKRYLSNTGFEHSNDVLNELTNDILDIFRRNEIVKCWA